MEKRLQDYGGNATEQQAGIILLLIGCAGWGLRLLLLLAGKEPVHRLAELEADCQEYGRTWFSLPMLQCGKVALCDSDASSKLLLRHIETPELANSPANRT